MPGSQIDVDPWRRTALAAVGTGALVARSLLELPGLARMALVAPLLLLLLWFIWRLTRPRALIRSSLELPLLAAAASLAASSLLAIADGTATLQTLIHWGMSAVLLFLTIDLLAAGWHPRMFARAVLLSVSIGLVFSAAYLLEHWWTWISLRQPGAQLFPIAARIRLFGAHPNFVAMLVNIGLPLAIVAMWRARAAWARWLWGCWLLLATLVLFFTSSRGGWATAAIVTGMALAVLLWGAYRARQWRRIGWALLLASGYAALFMTLLLANRVQVESQHGNSLVDPMGRTLIWQRALAVFAEQPLFGVGPGGFDLRFQTEELSGLFFRAQHAHSLYLTALSEQGVAGALALLALAALAAYAWRRCWRAHSASRSATIPTNGQTSAPHASAPLAGDAWYGEERLLMLACGASGISIFVHGLVDTPSPLLAGLALIVLAASLAPARVWAWAPAQRAAENRGVATGRLSLVLFALRSSIARMHPLHLALVLAALFAWGGYMFVSRQSARWDALRAAGSAALRQGDTARARALYEQAINLDPQRGAAYSERTAALAQRALDDPRTLSDALAAADVAIRRDPVNHIAPLNRAMLLAQAGRAAQAEAELQAFAAEVRPPWSLPYLLLAHLREQAGDQAAAETYWQRALVLQPDLAESAACLQSAVCPQLPLPASSYTALAEARRLAEQPNAAALAAIWRLADTWDSVDIWAVGALAAARSGDTLAQRRFLTAASDQAKQVTSSTTQQLAIVLLHEAAARDDRAELAALLHRWSAPPARLAVPQIARLLATRTDLALARATVEAATQLGDTALLAQAQAYLSETTAAFKR